MIFDCFKPSNTNKTCEHGAVSIALVVFSFEAEAYKE